MRTFQSLCVALYMISAPFVSSADEGDTPKTQNAMQVGIDKQRQSSKQAQLQGIDTQSLETIRKLGQAVLAAKHSQTVNPQLDAMRTEAEQLEAELNQLMTIQAPAGLISGTPAPPGQMQRATAALADQQLKALANRRKALSSARRASYRQATPARRPVYDNALVKAAEKKSKALETLLKELDGLQGEARTEKLLALRAALQRSQRQSTLQAAPSDRALKKTLQPMDRP